MYAGRVGEWTRECRLDLDLERDKSYCNSDIIIILKVGLLEERGKDGDGA